MATATEPLHVLVIAPVSWRTPPRHYGPWEQFASLLAEGLVAAGHRVTLAATADSLTAGELVGTVPRPLSEDPDLDAKVWETLHVATAMERAVADGVDLVHNSADLVPLAFSRLVDVPMVTTIHGFGSTSVLPIWERYADRCAYVAISDADRQPSLPYAATIHHGIDLDAFPPSTEPADELLFFGRIHPDKGTATAIEVARRVGLPLTIAGIVHDEAYFDAEVRPHLDGDRVRYLGSVGPDDRAQLLGRASALLHLIDFEEPFGFSVVEALACGTPVVAFPRGSMQELIVPGRDGALVDDVAGAVAAIDEVRSLPRQTIRDAARARFGVARMVDEYVALYRRVLADV